MTGTQSREQLRRRAVKRRDAWWTVLVIDPLALPVLSLLLRLPWVTPLGITATGSLLGLGAVVAFFAGHLVVGAILFELRFFLDCLDGKLARVRGLSSTRGAFVDLTSDVVMISAAVVGLGWHLAHHEPHVPIALSGATAFAALVLFWLILYDLDHPDPTRALPDTAATTGLSGWLARHRLHRLPRTIETETLLLFIAPLTGNQIVLTTSFALALASYVLASARLFVRLWHRTEPPARSSPTT